MFKIIYDSRTFKDLLMNAFNHCLSLLIMFSNVYLLVCTAEDSAEQGKNNLKVATAVVSEDRVYTAEEQQAMINYAMSLQTCKLAGISLEELSPHVVNDLKAAGINSFDDLDFEYFNRTVLPNHGPIPPVYYDRDPYQTDTDQSGGTRSEDSDSDEDCDY